MKSSLKFAQNKSFSTLSSLKKSTGSLFFLIAPLIFASPLGADTTLPAISNVQKVELIDALTGIPEKAISYIQMATSLTITPDGQCAYLGYKDLPVLHKIELATGNELETITLANPPKKCEINASGTTLYVVYDDSSEITVINVETGEPEYFFFLNPHPKSVALSADERILHVAQDNTDHILSIEIESGKMVKSPIYDEDVFFAYTDTIKNLHLSSDGKQAHITYNNNAEQAIVTLLEKNLPAALKPSEESEVDTVYQQYILEPLSKVINFLNYGFFTVDEESVSSSSTKSVSSSKKQIAALAKVEESSEKEQSIQIESSQSSEEIHLSLESDESDASEWPVFSESESESESDSDSDYDESVTPTLIEEVEEPSPVVEVVEIEDVKEVEDPIISCIVEEPVAVVEQEPVLTVTAEPTEPVAIVQEEPITPTVPVEQEPVVVVQPVQTPVVTPAIVTTPVVTLPVKTNTPKTQAKQTPKETPKTAFKTPTKPPVQEPKKAIRALPTVTALSATTGPTTGGTPVKITGTNFAGATAVTFGSKAALRFTVNTDTSITAVVPAGTGTVNVTVTTPSGKSMATRFTYQASPTVIKVSPSKGAGKGGKTVTIVGHNFTDVTNVKFGSSFAQSFTVISPTKIKAVTPPGTDVVNVSVITKSGTSSPFAGNQYTYGKMPKVKKVKVKK